MSASPSSNALAAAVAGRKPVRKIARNPKPWLKLAGWQIDELAHICSGKAQMVVMMRIMLATYSASRAEGAPAPEWTDDTTLRSLAHTAGVSAEAIGMVVRDAVRRRLAAQKPGSKPGTYRFKALVEEWPFIEDYEPEKLAKKPAQQAVTAENKGEDEANEVRSGLRTIKDAPVRATTEPLVLLPGAKSRPVPLSVACRTYVVDSQVNTPLVLESRVDEAAVLHFSIRGAPPGAAEVRSALRTSKGQAVCSQQNDPAKLATLRKGLAPLLRRHGAVPENQLLTGILQRLGGSPVETYLREAAQALDKTGVRNAKGLAMRVAEQVGANTKAVERGEAEQRALDERAKKWHIPGGYAAVVRKFLEVSADPSRHADVKWLLEQFPELKSE
jgi:hypothetical protein